MHPQQQTAVITGNRALLEKQLLACFLLDGGKDCNLLEPVAKDFISSECAEIYRTMREIVSAGGVADPQTIYAKNRKHAAYMAEVLNTVATSANRDFYGRNLCEEIARDKTAEIRARLAKQAAEGKDLAEISQAAQIDIDAVEAKYNGGKSEKTFADEMADVLASVRERKQAIKTFKFGFQTVDNLTYGLAPGECVILAARPSCGKTAFITQLLISAAFSGHNTTFFSCEMTPRAIAARVIANVTGTDTRAAVRDPSAMNKDQYDRIMAGSEAAYAVSQMMDVKNGTGKPWGWFAEVARRSVKAGSQLIALDYMQLLDGPGMNRQESVQGISRRWKALLMELKVPGVMLSQLSRDCEKENRLPKLSDLRESGGIEQDADIIWFLSPNKELGAEGVTLSQAKGRDVGVGIRSLRFLREKQQFEEARK